MKQLLIVAVILLSILSVGLAPVFAQKEDTSQQPIKKEKDKPKEKKQDEPKIKKEDKPQKKKKEKLPKEKDKPKEDNKADQSISQDNEDKSASDNTNQQANDNSGSNNVVDQQKTPPATNEDDKTSKVIYKPTNTLTPNNEDKKPLTIPTVMGPVMYGQKTDTTTKDSVPDNNPPTDTTAKQKDLKQNNTSSGGNNSVDQQTSGGGQDNNNNSTTIPVVTTPPPPTKDDNSTPPTKNTVIYSPSTIIKTSIVNKISNVFKSSSSAKTIVNNNIFSTVYNPLSTLSTKTTPSTLLLLDSKQLLDANGADSNIASIQSLFCTTFFVSAYDKQQQTWNIYGTVQNINTITPLGIPGIKVNALFYNANGDAVGTISGIPLIKDTLAQNEESSFNFKANLNTDLNGQMPTFIVIFYTF